MVTVRARDLLKKAQEIIDAGYEYVSVDELDPEPGEIPVCLHFDAVEDYYGTIDFEDLDDIELPEDYNSGVH